ncbi:putative enoyl-CoA hydratase 1 [compost metagenome]|uniref:MaoC family dehydratase n=1 Tax=Pseudomonas TaxID=286 RepID=UPI00041C227A|nr:MULTISPECIES: MaoC family dehydratase [Pseudomonas]MCW2270785.1 acyl dehydratase [Pseudomonas sp. JUb96]PRA65991.1 nodulation protein NodN [Pseudomonas sp. MYb187]
MNLDYHYDHLARFVGTELGVSEWATVDQARIDEFAHCTEDHQWIHVDPVRCQAESPFGTTIAHGFLNLSLLGGLMMQMGIVPAGVSSLVNAGVTNVRFKNAVRAGSRVRARASVHSAEVKDGGRTLLILLAQLELEGAEEPALTAECVAMLFRDAQGDAVA